MGRSFRPTQEGVAGDEGGRGENSAVSFGEVGVDPVEAGRAREERSRSGVAGEGTRNRLE